MSILMQTVIVAVLVAGAAAMLIWRTFGKRAKPGCGCNGCPAKPTARR